MVNIDSTEMSSLSITLDGCSSTGDSPSQRTCVTSDDGSLSNGIVGMYGTPTSCLFIIEKLVHAVAGCRVFAANNLPHSLHTTFCFFEYEDVIVELEWPLSPVELILFALSVDV